MAAGDQLVVKTGTRPSARLGGCTGAVVTGAEEDTFPDQLSQNALI